MINRHTLSLNLSKESANAALKLTKFAELATQRLM
jgi:hypothetical protein